MKRSLSAETFWVTNRTHKINPPLYQLSYLCIGSLVMLWRRMRESNPRISLDRRALWPLS